MGMTTKELQQIREQGIDIRKAVKSGAVEAARNAIERQVGDINNIARRSVVLPETECIGKFEDIWKGRHVKNEEYAMFQKAADDAAMVGLALGHIVPIEKDGRFADVRVDPMFGTTESYRLLKRRFPKLMEEAAMAAKEARKQAMRSDKPLDTLDKALYSTGTAVGDEWVPTVTSGTLEDQIRLEAKIAPLFRTFDLPAATWTVPVRGALPNFVIINESTGDTPTNITAGNTTTANRTFTTKKLGLRIVFSEELVEDSVIAVLPWLRDELAQAAAHDHDYAILNGDTTNPHQDSDNDTATHRGRTFIGVRKMSNAAANVNGSTFNLAALRNVRALIGKAAHDVRNLAYITSVEGYMRMLGIAEVLTIDLFGQNATVLNGELARLDGIPIIVSSECRSNLNASGVYDGTTMNKTIVQLVNTKAFALGRRRGLTLKQFDDARSDTHQLMATFRTDFQAFEPYASVNLAGYVYNIALTA